MGKGGMPDLGGLMQAAQKMQREMARIQEELASKTVDGQAGGGMVTVTANGQMQLTRVKIDKNAVDPNDVGMLEDLVTAAANQALAKAKEMANAEMSKAAGGLNIPGMPGMF